jgi:hypothetical protein
LRLAPNLPREESANFVKELLLSMSKNSAMALGGEWRAVEMRWVRFLSGTQGPA